MGDFAEHLDEVPALLVLLADLRLLIKTEKYIKRKQGTSISAIEGQILQTKGAQNIDRSVVAGLAHRYRSAGEEHPKIRAGAFYTGIFWSCCSEGLEAALVDAGADQDAPGHSRC